MKERIKNWLIRLLGGYPDLQSAIIAIKKDDLASKNQILTEAVKHLFNTVSADDVLQLHEGGALSIGSKRPLTEQEVNNLREEVKILEKLRVWKLLQNEVQYQCNIKLFNEALITYDILWGKLILWYNDVLKTCLKRLKEAR